MKKITKLLLTLVVFITVLPKTVVKAEDDICDIQLSSTLNADSTYTHTVTVDGKSVNEYDYTWNVDPTVAHDDVKNSPAEYYTGTEPSEDEEIYIAHDIYYYPELDSSKYVKAQYDDEVEWLYYYEIEEYKDYIFATLPVQGTTVPTEMMHSAEEAYTNAVLHINKAGTYRLSGNWHGQVYIDLGEDSFDDPTQVVTLILDNVDIECTVASGICFYQVYEVDNTWEDRETAISSIDTTGAGANVVIADDSTNTVSGTNIYRILKTKYKDEDSTATIKVQKKSKKIDAAFYSYMSMNISGEEKANGVLNINSEFEGLDTELHLTINSGNINIVSGNDGINVNEDYVSIVTINGGTVQILAGTGYEGDGIDSNGYIRINGGTVISCAKPQSDSGLDAETNTFINGGTVIATGSSMDLVTEYSEDSDQVTLNLVFSKQVNVTDKIVIKDTEGQEVYSFDLSNNELYKDANRTYQCLVVSSSAFKVDDEYNIYLNDEQLSYSGTSAGVRGGGMMPQMGNQQGGNFDANNMPNGNEGNSMPNNFDPNNQSGDFDTSTRPEMPDGEQGTMTPGNFDPNNQNNGNQNFDANNKPELPEGMDESDMPNNFDPNNKPDESSENGEDDFDFKEDNNSQTTQSTEAKTVFTIEDKVNTYTNVSTNTASSTNTTVVENNTSSNNMVYLAAGVAIGALVVAFAVILFKKKKQTNNEKESA